MVQTRAWTAPIGRWAGAVRLASCLAGAAALVGVIQGTAAAAQPVTISFSYWGSIEENEIWSALIDAFEEDQPQIRVERLYVTSDYDKKLQVMIAAGTAPDVMAWEDKRALPLVPSGAFRDLGPFIARDRSFKREMYYPQSMEDFQFKGRQWGLPWDFVTTALAYNRDLFDQAGIPRPATEWNDAAWNWQTFAETARKLTLDRDGNGTPDQWGFINSYSWSRWRIWVWQNGGLDWEPTGTQSLLTSNASVSALQFYSDLTNVHRVSPKPSEIGRLGGELGMFTNQRAAMINAAGYNLPYFRTRLDFNWNLAPFAHGPVRPASPFIPDGVAISAATKHPEQAWELVKFIVGLKAQRLMAERGYRISPHREVIGRFVSPATPQREEIWMEAIPHAILTNYTTKWSEIEYDTLGPAMQSLLEGRLSARQMVEQINPKISALLSEAETRFAK